MYLGYDGCVENRGTERQGAAIDDGEMKFLYLSEYVHQHCLFLLAEDSNQHALL